MTATFGSDGKTIFSYAAAGPRVATRIRRSNRLQVVASAGVSEHIPHCLQWPPAGEGRFSDPPAGAKYGSTSSPWWGPNRPRNPLALYGVFHQKATFTKPRGVFRQHPLRRPTIKLRVFALSILTPQKHGSFAIGNFANAINFEVSDQQKRPNLVHSDSKPCFSVLGRSPRPPAIDFLGLSGSWAPEPLQTLSPV